MPTLLSLPREIRDIIWSMVFLGDEANTQVLAVSRQVCREAEKYPYKRPLVFQTQRELYHWQAQVGTSHLKHVDALSFGLTSGRDRSSHPTANLDLNYLDRDHLEDGEEAKLVAALESMPNITILAVLKDGTNQSRQYHGFYSAVLKKIGSLFPALQCCSASPFIAMITHWIF
jgi:hypothetical protein